MPSDKRAKVIALHHIQIESPCTASWAAMRGNDRVRHCSDCNKDVFNLSAMAEAEAAELLAGNDGNLCVRFYRRQDGTVMTSDCSTSLRAATRRSLRKIPAAAGVALLAISASAAADQQLPLLAPEVVQAGPTMGAPPPPPAAPAVVKQEQKVTMIMGERKSGRVTPAPYGKKPKP